MESGSLRVRLLIFGSFLVMILDYSRLLLDCWFWNVDLGPDHPRSTNVLLIMLVKLIKRS